MQKTGGVKVHMSYHALPQIWYKIDWDKKRLKRNKWHTAVTLKWRKSTNECYEHWNN